MQEEIKKDNQEWHKRRGKMLMRKRRLAKMLDLIDRALTWIGAVNGDE